MACYDPKRVPVYRKPIMDGSARTRIMTDVTCGRCLGCRTSQARDWAFRLVHESWTVEDAYFVTLTYDEPNLPLNGTLVPEHFQKWMKRLRRRNQWRVSYYGCGEYGDESDRPHYHAVVLGKNLFLDRTEIGRRNGYKIFDSEMLRSSWRFGNVILEAMGYGAAAYVAGYVRKKVSKLDNPDHYERVNPLTGELVHIEAEFSRMSRRPAIGKRWIEENWRDVYPRDFLVMNGYEFRPPRFYDRWMDEHHPEVMEEVRDRRWADRKEYSKQELAAMKRHHESRVGLFQGRSAI